MGHATLRVWSSSSVVDAAWSRRWCFGRRGVVRSRVLQVAPRSRISKAVPICWVWVFQSPKYVVGVSSWCPDHQAPRVGWLLPSAGFVFSVSSWWWSTSWFWMSLSKNLATVVPIYSNDDTFFTWIARFCLTASSHFYMVSLLVLVAKPTRAIWVSVMPHLMSVILHNALAYVGWLVCGNIKNWGYWFRI
jgi:hypothetical protein